MMEMDRFEVSNERTQNPASAAVLNRLLQRHAQPVMCDAFDR